MSWLSESDYNFIYSRAPRVCVDLVIKTKTGVHLVKRDIQPYKGKYHLPGGRVRFRESIEKAIQRIAKTELNCFVKIGKMIGFMEFPRELQNKQRRHSISITFVVKPNCKIDSKKIDSKKILSVHYKFLKSIRLL